MIEFTTQRSLVWYDDRSPETTRGFTRYPRAWEIERSSGPGQLLNFWTGSVVRKSPPMKHDWMFSPGGETWVIDNGTLVSYPALAAIRFENNPPSLSQTILFEAMWKRFVELFGNPPKFKIRLTFRRFEFGGKS